jgi:uncharacterized protein
MDRLIIQHRETIRLLAEQRGVRNVRVFGSMARNTATAKSNVDLLVELESGRTGLALGGFLQDISELLGRKVDVVTEQSFKGQGDAL